MYIAFKLLEKICGEDGLPLSSFIIQFKTSNCEFFEFDFSYIVVLIILIIVAYIAGHIVSYLSSITIKKFAIWCYRNPSQYLLAGNNTIVKGCYFVNDTYSVLSNEDFCTFKILYRILMAIFLIPITLYTFIVNCLGFYKYFIRPLDDIYIKTFNNKKEILEKKLFIVKESDSENRDYDFRSLIKYYEYNKQTVYRDKLNYFLASYGFLRSISFVFIILFWSCFYLYFFAGWRCEFICSEILVFVLIPFISYVCFVAYLKFYRRYTVEVFMLLVSDDISTNMAFEQKDDK